MNTTIEDLIKEVAVKHGLALSQDDPLMILPTINQRLITDFNQNLEENLTALREALELILKQWRDQVSSNNFNSGSEISTAPDLQISSGAIRQAMRAEIAAQLLPIIKRAETASQFALIVAAISLLTSAAMIWLLWHP